MSKTLLNCPKILGVFEAYPKDSEIGLGFAPKNHRSNLICPKDL
jgi:hypothetical protein